MAKIKLGKYRHYKGKEYKVIGLAKHSETLEEYVVYQALYNDHQLWIRPVNMFFETVVKNNTEISRFELVDENYI